MTFNLANLIKTPLRRTRSYSGMSDFFIRASDGEKRGVIEKAAREANREQLRTLEQAHAKRKAFK